MCIQRGTLHHSAWQQHRYLLGLVLAVWLSSSSLLLVPSPVAAVGIDLPAAGSPICATQKAEDAVGISASTIITYLTFFPVIGKPFSCQPIAGATYGTVVPSTPPVSVPPPINPEYNLSLRGYDPTNASLDLQYYGGATDSGAPKLYSLFTGTRPANFRTVYRVHKWDYACGCRSPYYEDDNYPVTLGGLAATPGELVLIPSSSYDIGTMTSGYGVMVLYATMTQLTFRYGREDDIRGDLPGYVIHLENVCVDPNLLALYNYWDSVGRRARLPALYRGQALGRAINNEIGIVIRDWASFMDPRSKKDWW